MADQPDYRDTVFLPKTDFPMKAGLAQKEPAILAQWAADDLYGTLRAARAAAEKFILHDGPPYANGDIHMGHAMNKVLKDIIVRSQSLMGKDAPYVPGWDCHGLPIEWKIEEEYRKKKLNKDEVPPQEFRAECRAYAAKWVDIQREQFKRLGVMGDWDDPYLTMKFDAEAAIVGELLKFAQSGQLYRGAKPVMWSPVEKTALAEAEVEYEDIVSTQIDVAFEIVESPNSPAIAKVREWCSKVEAVVWTTTPWTIPVNQALAYGVDTEYSIVNLIWRPSTFGSCYIVASDLVEAFVSRVRANPILHDQDDTEVDCSVVGTLKGGELAGAIARHPMANSLRHPGESRGPASSSTASEGSETPDQVRGDAEWEQHLAFFAKPRPFLPGDFVTTETGTGLVHMAPDHGEDDFLLCKAHGIGPQFAVEGDGKYRADWEWLGGQGSVINPKFNAPDGPICTDLREAGGLLAASADYKHSYPHSWRSKAKVIFRCTPQWFIPMDRSAPSSAEDIPLCATEAEIRAAQSSPLPRAGGAGGGRTGAAGDALVDSASPPLTPPASGRGTNATTLRQTALAAIADTRWVPEKARNRIHAMVDGRPDWVISRQRAWGVPIALYVNRKTGDYLRDGQVDARIIAAFREGGADAWFTADHQALLGPDHALADYEPVNDILDVWFDSGSTHAFVMEARFPGTRASLYLEGSDQHRGWFQSSLLESCGTRGRAPYDAVLTHGFALDGQGRKMSKSLGNVVDPLKIMETSGADILRLWVASTDYFEDVRIGNEILSGTSDAYRKLRNTFRYLLGALEGFTEDERVTDIAAMPELERYVLHLLAKLDQELRDATAAFEFNRYSRALSEFANNDLSAFFFDIRKDCLYCDAPTSEKRRAYRTVLDILFHALVRYAAPILCFTAEEVWSTRFPEAGSVHLLEWPDFNTLLRHPRASGDPSPDLAQPHQQELDSRLRGNDELGAKWERLREVRASVTAKIEPLRRDKIVGSGLEAFVEVYCINQSDIDLVRSVDFDELAIVSGSEIKLWTKDDSGLFIPPSGGDFQSTDGIAVTATRINHHKCGRCWRHLPEVTEDGALCARCDEVVHG